MKKLIALLLAAVMIVSLAACGSEKEDDVETTATGTEATDAADATDATEETEETDATEETEETEATEPYVPEIGEGIFSRVSYTADDEQLAGHLDDVVATVGDAELTVSQLQVYYWMYIYSFLNDYYYYLEYFGLDISLPLDQQECSGSDGTWQQYFITEALNSWHTHQALAQDAAANEIPIDDSIQEELDAFDEELETAAEEGEYESVEQMLHDNIGPGVTVDGYKAYLLAYYTSLSNYEYQYDNFEITDDMIETYFTENEETLAESDITKESGKLVDVRHILLTPEGGTTDDDGNTTYSDDEWTACEAAAQAVLDQWLAGEKTEESFAQLANEYSTDPGSNTNGGLYESVATGEMVDEFDAWCFDDSRQVGDYGLVKTTYGYHVMFYSGDEAQWIYECRSAILSEKINEFLNETVDAYSLNVDYEKILVGDVDLDATE